MKLLKFVNGNSKIPAGIFILNLVAGYSCPFAQLCLSKAHRKTGKITDGKHVQFRCYAASADALYPNVRDSHWRNFDLLKKCQSKQEMVELILASLPRFGMWFRLHSGGDYFSQMYFDAWLQVAKLEWRKMFYAYTKSLPYWVRRLKDIPDNLILTASYGGTHDSLIAKHQLRYAEVVFSEQEAVALGLEIDHDDSLARSQGPSFALLIHGPQPAGSEASRAVVEQRRLGNYGYGERAAKIRQERGEV